MSLMMEECGLKVSLPELSLIKLTFRISKLLRHLSLLNAASRISFPRWTKKSNSTAKPTPRSKLSPRPFSRSGLWISTSPVQPARWWRVRLGMIPRGWRVGTLEELAAEEKNAIVDGPFGTQMKISEYREYGVPVVEMGYLEGYPFYKPFKKHISREKFKEVKRSRVKANDIVISKTGTLGLLGIVTDMYANAVIVSRLAKITPHPSKTHTYYLFYQLKQLSDKKYWDTIASGSTMPLLNLPMIKNVDVLIPPTEFQIKFGEICESLYQVILNNLKESFSLVDLRDMLLSKLMSGQVEV